MGSRVNVSEKSAREMCAAAGVMVSKRTITKYQREMSWYSNGKLGTKMQEETHSQFTVGSQLVEYDTAWGGAACWRVNGTRGGYIGEAIKKALDIELSVR